MDEKCFLFSQDYNVKASLDSVYTTEQYKTKDTE
jgi:hypothetical protein